MSDYSKKNIRDSLLKLDLKKNDIIFCHSNIGYFGKIKNTKSKDKLCKIFLMKYLMLLAKKGHW